MRSEVASQLGEQRIKGQRRPQMHTSRPVHVRALRVVVLERRQALEAAQRVRPADHEQVVQRDRLLRPAAIANDATAARQLQRKARW